MLKADFTASFSRDRKRCVKKHWDVSVLDAALIAVMTCDETPLRAEYNDHALTGDLQGYRVLHVGGRTGDWILLYQIVDDEVFFISTGPHDDVLRH